MKLFFKFFWMGISKLLYVLFTIAIILIVIAVPILIGITFGFILNRIMNLILAILLSIVITIICYCIEDIIYHSIKAIVYCKEYNTDSLETAWKKTATDWNSYL